jgi:hypothetical protein
VEEKKAKKDQNTHHVDQHLLDVRKKVKEKLGVKQNNMKDNFSMHNWRLQQAIKEIDEATFTDKHDDNPELKGGQKDLPDELQAKIVAKEGEDHEVSMAQSSLKSIIGAASELMSKIGNEEFDIPGWIQDHITNSENYISQANKGYHKLDNEYED